MNKRKLSLREYALENSLSLSAVYQRIWAGRQPGAVKVDGRWVVEVEGKPSKKQQAQ